MTQMTASRTTTVPPSMPSTPRLRLEPTGARDTLLDGGWWPRSTDPVADLPGLVLAIGRLHGPVIRLVLSAEGWEGHPRRLAVAGRVLRLGYFTSQPDSLLTAVCDNGERVDLLIVPPDTTHDIADAAMRLAATAGNRIHAQHILLAASTPKPRADDGQPEDVWESEGGFLAPSPNGSDAAPDS